MSNVFDRMTSNNRQLVDAPQSEAEHSDAIEGIPAEGTPLTAADVKQAVQELLKQGHIDETAKPDLFKSVLVREQEILVVLEPLDLAVKIDSHRGVVFLVVAESSVEATDQGEEWSHPLVRRQRLTLEQSLLVALLRQAFVMHEQEVGIGHSAAKISVDDLLPQVRVYFGDSGSDNRDESRLHSLLEQLKVHGIVSEVDKNNEVIIRPLITHLANPQSLSALLRMLQEETSQHEANEGTANE